MEGNVLSQSPPQWTGNSQLHAVADRAKTTASPGPRRSRSSSKTVWLYRYG